MIRIHPISGNKKQYLDLLLLADEQESMIDRYLERGEMFILSDNDTVKASCVITCEDKGIYEIKSIAVYPEYQRQGYGRQLIAFVLEHYKDRCHTMLVGTGDSPLTIPFYESCGFAYSHRVPDFFIDNYDHPIFEGGKQLKDMIYLKRMLQPRLHTLWKLNFAKAAECPCHPQKYSEPMPTVASTRNIAPIAISTVILHKTVLWTK